MIYTYRCTNEECSIQMAEFEISHSIHADPAIVCEECSGACSRVITGGSGTLFKGDSWGCKQARAHRGMHGEPLRPNAKSKRRYTSAAGVAPGKSRVREA